LDDLSFEDFFAFVVLRLSGAASVSLPEETEGDRARFDFDFVEDICFGKGFGVKYERDLKGTMGSIHESIR
jgi:hypothetical protein